MRPSCKEFTWQAGKLRKTCLADAERVPVSVEMIASLCCGSRTLEMMLFAFYQRNRQCCSASPFAHMHKKLSRWEITDLFNHAVPASSAWSIFDWSFTIDGLLALLGSVIMPLLILCLSWQMLAKHRLAVDLQANLAAIADE